ncbi:MAG: RluA family pseudouridine synthase [Chloroflexi bacterium]|nr:RluA family pseudouridine synthase [Chloroflexota bacterium]
MTVDTFKRWEISEGGQRLDRFLASQVADLSRASLQRLIHEARVLVDGAEAKASHRLTPGEVVTLDVPPPEPPVLIAESIDVPIVYEDDDLIVVDKPAGMVVHPGHGVSAGTLVNAMLAHCPGLAAFEDSLRPGIVHRLDKDTSGVMVVAKTPAAQQNLIAQFAARTIKKTYWALVHGRVESEQGLIEAAIGRSRSQPTRMAISGKAERPARTAFRVLRRFAAFTLIEAQPVTGRTHQIRLHFAALGHPLAGDAAYGRPNEAIALARQFLHARALRLRMPSSGVEREFGAPLPADLQSVLDSLR